jgi:hypothetical protein
MPTVPNVVDAVGHLFQIPLPRPVLGPLVSIPCDLGVAPPGPVRGWKLGEDRAAQPWNRIVDLV